MGSGRNQAVRAERTLSRIVRRRQALRDVAAIWSHIAEDDETAAYIFVERVDATLGLLADYPRRGTPRRAKMRDLRSFAVGRYILFYQPIADGIRLIRVLHGPRDLRAAGIG